MKNNIIITVIVAVLVGAGAFFGGMKFQQSKQPVRGGVQGARTGMGRGMGFRPVTGDIIDQSDKSITVKLADGSSKIVLFSDTTSIGKSTDGSKSDLKVGEKVAVFGTDNPDGSVTAQNIQLNPRR